MASLDLRNDTYSVVFRFAGRKFTRSLKTGDRKEAETRRLNLERTIREVQEGRMALPDGVDLPLFLLSDGRLGKAVTSVEPPASLPLDQLFAV